MSIASRARHVKKPSPCTTYNRFPQPIKYGCNGKGPSGGESVPTTKGAHPDSMKRAKAHRAVILAPLHQRHHMSPDAFNVFSQEARASRQRAAAQKSA